MPLWPHCAIWNLCRLHWCSGPTSSVAKATSVGGIGFPICGSYNSRPAAVSWQPGKLFSVPWTSTQRTQLPELQGPEKSPPPHPPTHTPGCCHHSCHPHGCLGFPTAAIFIPGFASGFSSFITGLDSKKWIVAPWWCTQISEWENMCRIISTHLPQKPISFELQLKGQPSDCVFERENKSSSFYAPWKNQHKGYSAQ